MKEETEKLTNQPKLFSPSLGEKLLQENFDAQGVKKEAKEWIWASDDK